MKDNAKIRVVLVGGSGYAGFEAVRWLLRHDRAELVGIFGPEGELGAMEQFYPLLSKQVSLSQRLYSPAEAEKLDADVAMLAVPHKVAMTYVPTLREMGLRVIDFSADYRLRDRGVYEQWYCEHTDADRLSEAVYGLPEYYAEQIRKADLVANPGCYPTSVILPLAPLLAEGLIEPEGIVASSASGVSGAGRKPNAILHFPERNENFEPYKVGSHRHMPEMEQVLGNISGAATELLFQPHLSPMDRGILSSIYARPTTGTTEKKLTDALHAAYDNAAFVRVRDDVLPATKYVANTNFCDVAARLTKGTVVAFGALDNLIKGAAGQAIQNMNVMFDLDERTGLY
ncbi:MAG: N-acetyl-gamma-glutamyl-phosphate reductase [Phycisphaerae bacterium]